MQYSNKIIRKEIEGKIYEIIEIEKVINEVYT